MKTEPMTESQLAVIGFVERWAAAIESFARFARKDVMTISPDDTETLINAARMADTEGLTENEMEAAINLASAALIYGHVLKESVTPKMIYGSRE